MRQYPSCLFVKGIGMITLVEKIEDQERQDHEADTEEGCRE